jgi:glycerol-3-phosphate cytidylyltransferase
MRVYTGGTFDLFHRGHVNFLRSCKKLGYVIVSLNTDEFITAYKGKPSVMTYDERRDVLLACKYVDEVVPNTGGADSKPAIENARADIVIVGTDWAVKDYYKQMQFTQEWLDERGILLVYLPYDRSISTTELKLRICK